MNLNLKRPCKNCPFLVEGAIELRPGRVDGIVRGMLADDTSTFFCHKTVHAKNADGRHIENDDGSITYVAGKKDSACVGAMVVLLKLRNPNVAMRMGAAFKMIDFDELRALDDRVIDPATLDLEIRSDERPRRRGR